LTTPTALTATEDCNRLVVRSDARHVTQRYEQFLAPIGLRATQFSILTKLKRRDAGFEQLAGPVSMVISIK
jgi:hypothetical protein